MISRALVIGSMNCMPTEYAILLKKYCVDVIHYYDAAEDDSLSNPCIRWGKNSSLRTSGVILRKIRFYHYLSYLLPRFFHKNLIAQIDRADLVVLSGPAISLARFARRGSKKIIALSYGSDISMFCNREWPNVAMPNRPYLKGLIRSQLGSLKARFVELQIEGLRSCTHYSYFIPGLDVKTDAMIERILTEINGPIRLPRYSIGLDLLTCDKRSSAMSNLGAKFKLLFPVRFCEDELLGDKGWRVLFDGLAKFRQQSQASFVCVCFRKGDFSAARFYAKELGIDDAIEWHEVVPFDTLVQYYCDADVIIEQLGSHWIAQGLFAMALGKPVIGRVSTVAQREFFTDSGLLEVNDADSLAKQLMNCESVEFRREMGEKSRAFVPARAAIEPEFLKWGLV